MQHMDDPSYCAYITSPTRLNHPTTSNHKLDGLNSRTTNTQNQEKSNPYIPEKCLLSRIPSMGRINCRLAMLQKLTFIYM